MNTSLKWDATRKCEATATFPSTGRTREWWHDQSRIDRTDWISLIKAAETALERLRSVRPPSQGDVTITHRWNEVAEEAWADPPWREAAREYRDARGNRVLIAEINPERLQPLRRLMGEEIARGRAWAEMNLA